MKRYAGISRHLDPRRIRSLLEIGDILIPGDEKLPCFSRSRRYTEVDRMLDYMGKDDLDGVKLLLLLLSFFPRFALRALLRWITNHPESSIARLLGLGLKGVVYSLYYGEADSDTGFRAKIGWITHCGDDFQGRKPGMSPSELAFVRVRRAQNQLRKLSVAERLDAIAPLEKIILARQEELIATLQKETHKSKTDALMSEIFPILEHLHSLHQMAEKVLADRKASTPIALMGKKSKVFFEPMGTILVISPWNYPLYQALVPITSALICGNSVVYKPSEETPLQGVVEALLREAGIPEDWVQIVYGDGKTGSELIEQKPQKIFFTGSARTGARIMEQASKHLIPVELELGGKDPMIVFDDANLDRAVSGAAWGALTNCGQSCTSVESIHVQESIYETFKQKLHALLNNVPTQDLGEMTTQMQIGIIADQIQDARAKGARLLTGSGWDLKSGAIPPILLEGVKPSMKIYDEETFGPVIPIFSFKTEEEVIARVNRSQYGLSSSVWSKDLVRAERVARKLDTGNVSINNVMLTEGNHALPFGGTKRSGFGRYKGEFGFYSFSNIKAVLVDGDSRKIEANWYPYTEEKYSLFSAMMDGLFRKKWLKFAINGIKLESHANQAGKRLL